MRKLSLFLALALVLAFVGGAIAQTVIVGIDNITNMYSGGLRAGATHVASIRFDARNAAPPGDPPAYWAGSNEIEIYSPEGAQWTSVTGSINTPLVNQLAVTVNKYKKHNFFDGSTWSPVPTAAGNGPVGPSTGPTCRASYWLTIADFNGADGWEGGVDNDIAITLTFSTLLSDGDLAGTKHMCIDSATANVAWEWGNPTIDNPVWDNDMATAGVQDGPRCLQIYLVPNIPPEWCNGLTGNVSFNHCDEGSFQLCANDTDGPSAVTYSIVGDDGHHGVITGDTWTWSGMDVPQNAVVYIHFLAYDGADHSADEFVLQVTTTNHAPTLTCDPGPTVGATELGTNCESVKVTPGDVDLCDLPFEVSDFTVTPPASVTGAYEIVRLGAGTIPDPYTYYLKFCPLLADAALPQPLHFGVKVSDGDVQLDAECGIDFTVIIGAPYGVVIQKDSAQVQGVFDDIAITLKGYDPNEGLGGFDLLIAYDASALAFQLAYEGQIYNQDNATLPGCGWEYFTYRFGPYGNCGSACPSGMVRVIGMAETNNGPYHPDCKPIYVDDVPITLVYLRFLVSNDRTLECSFVPIRFFWYSCGDNTLSNFDGSKLFLSARVYDFQEYGWEMKGDTININDIEPGDGFPTYLGAQDQCVYENEQLHKIAKRYVDFQNGGVDIVCADSIDARGDINLNGLKNEIADAVMFTNYFIQGISAFGTHPEGSIAASDVNADGLALTVSDLVYLIRVIVGDAQPYDKAIPVAANVTYGDGNFSVDVPMGAAHIVIAGEVTPTLLATNMEMKYGVVDGNTNILVYSTEANQSFTGQFLNAEGRVISANLATFLGQPVNATVMPANYALHQNYPNPFNPTTTFKIDIPKVGENWTLNIYNVTGQLVQSFTGVSTGSDEVRWDASNNASGIYFYKLTAGDFSATKKAVLLK